MSPETLEASLDFVAAIAAETGQPKARVTFHGGEPLVAGVAFWRQALQGLERRFGRGGYEVSVQSNLWLLEDRICRLLRAHAVSVGTSLDGPQEITDAQRGPGYFARTVRGLRAARAAGLCVGCIATFTRPMAARWREVFDFFLAERLGMSIHAAVPALDQPDSPQALTPTQYGNLLVAILAYYIEHRREMAVSSLDQMCRAVGCGEGRVCTFRDCLGMFLVVDPRGQIYPCQRFCGRPAYRLGQLEDRPSLADLLASPVAQRMAERERRIGEACAGCSHVSYCRGGCAYNAWAGGNAERLKDPYCDAYRQVYDDIVRRVLHELASEENLQAMAAQPYTGRGHPLLRRGPLIELVREGPHPPGNRLR
jgi:uncharacterized protein